VRGPYTVTFREQSFATASGDYDFFELTPADDRPIMLIGLTIGVKSELQEAQEEQISYGIVRGNATTGNGTSATPRPVDSRDAAAGFTAETVASTPASAGTAIELMNDTFNVRSGLQLWLPEEYRFKIDQADTMLCVRLWTALADDATISGTAWVIEP
jgi:hypothetical protein